MSSGAVSIIGPLVGQLYWRGYLGAFNLTSEEFPAAESDVRSYAYLVIVKVVGEIWQLLVRTGGWTIAGMVLIVASVVLSQTARMRGKTASAVSRLRELARSDTVSGLVSQIIAVSIISLGAFAFLFYLTTVAVLAVIAPSSAMERGRVDGLARLNAWRTSSSLETMKCVELKLEGHEFKCPHPVAYGKDDLAIFDDGRIFRVPRATAKLSSPAPSLNHLGESAVRDNCPSL